MITNLITAAVVAAHVVASASVPQSAPSDGIELRALGILRDALASEARWTKVHAAEALLAAGERDGVARVFELELSEHGSEPEYRIGIWRVIAQAARDPRDRERWTRRIAVAFLDERGPDRLHASETLGKLAYRIRARELDTFERAARDGGSPLAANALWVLTNSGRAGAERRLADLLRARDAATRATAAYAVRYLAKLTPPVWIAVSEAARSETADDLARASLVAAAFVHAPPRERVAFRSTLVQYANDGTVDTKSEACGALAMAGGAGDLRELTPLFDDANVDVRVAAARAVLQIVRR